MVHLIEPLDERMARLVQHVTEVKTKPLSNQLKLPSEHQYVDTNLGKVNETLKKYDTQYEHCGRDHKILEQYGARAHYNQYRDTNGLECTNSIAEFDGGSCEVVGGLG